MPAATELTPCVVDEAVPDAPETTCWTVADAAPVAPETTLLTVRDAAPVAPETTLPAVPDTAPDVELGAVVPVDPEAPGERGDDAAGRPELVARAGAWCGACRNGVRRSA